MLMQKQLLRHLLFLVIVTASADLAASSVRILTKSPQQGSMIIGQADKGTQVFFRKQQLPLDDQGYFVFGVGRDSAGSVELTINESGKSSTLSLDIGQRQWNIERVDGLPPQKVNPRAPEVLERIRSEGRLVRQARQTKSELTYFKMPFVMPAEGRISGVYGSQRILNGDPKRPHFGLDVANKTGTPVIAPINGVVSLVHKDMFYSGGTLILDHGHGISSTYIHLNSIDVKPGDTVKQGQKIATIGASGRATGPHLDWRLNWFQTRLDPGLLVTLPDGR